MSHNWTLDYTLKHYLRSVGDVFGETFWLFKFPGIYLLRSSQGRSYATTDFTTKVDIIELFVAADCHLLIAKTKRECFNQSGRSMLKRMKLWKNKSSETQSIINVNETIKWLKRRGGTRVFFVSGVELNTESWITVKSFKWVKRRRRRRKSINFLILSLYSRSSWHGHAI